MVTKNNDVVFGDERARPVLTHKNLFLILDNFYLKLKRSGKKDDCIQEFGIIGDVLIMVILKFFARENVRIDDIPWMYCRYIEKMFSTQQILDCE